MQSTKWQFANVANKTKVLIYILLHLQEVICKTTHESPHSSIDKMYVKLIN